MLKNEGKGPFSSLLSSFSSLQLTIALLIILAVASIFGTVIPQNAPPEEYLRAYKVSTYKILKILGFLDMYHAAWFVSLLGLLSFNLVACSLKRFRQVWRFFSHPQEPLEETQWKTFPLSKNFSQKGFPAEHIPHFREAISQTFSQPKVLESPEASHLFAEKGKSSRLGVYFIHLSVLVILAGALIGSFWGFRGDFSVVEGEVADQVMLRSRRQAQDLGFKVRLDKFNVSFYPTGAPKEFKSTLTILEGNREVLNESIRVNHPLTYKGVSLYQSSYGVAGVEKAVLLIKDRDSGKETIVSARMETRTEIPGSSSSFILTRFLPDFQEMGPAFQVILFEPLRPHDNFWVFKNHPEFEEKRPGRYRFTIQDVEARYYSGLQVTKDPGVGVVWAGCFLMMAGFYMAFFMSHRRVWISLIQRGGATLVQMAGSSHRDRTGFEREFEKVYRALKDRTETAKR